MDHQPTFSLINLTLGLAVFCGILLLTVIFLVWRLRRLSARLDDETFRRQSLSTTYGRITEQCLTVLKLPLTEAEVERL